MIGRLKIFVYLNFSMFLDDFSECKNKITFFILSLQCVNNLNVRIFLFELYSQFVQFFLHILIRFTNNKFVWLIIAEKLDIDEERVTLEASFRQDLGADSLDTYELIYALEEELGIQIPGEKANEFETVGNAVSFIKSVVK